MGDGKNVQRQQGAIVAAVQETQWSAPIPPPEAIRQYEETLRGAFDRILTMAEKEIAARHEQGAKMLENDARKIEAEVRQNSNYHKSIRSAQVYSLIFMLGCVGSATWCAHSGQPWVAGVIGGATLVQIVHAMLSTKDKPRQ